MDNIVILLLIVDVAVIALVIYLLNRKIRSKLNEVEERHVMSGMHRREISDFPEEE